MPTKAKQGELYTMSIAQKCGIVGCTNKYDRFRRGYCPRHYESLKKYGDPLFIANKKASYLANKPTACKVDGCNGNGLTRKKTGTVRFPNGYCSMHYNRLWNTGKLERTVRIKNGFNGHPLSYIYYGMHARCYDKSHSSYGNYGARGIKVCERWHKMSNFVEDMGIRPEGTTLDRIDVNGNYEPSNCRWATYQEQARNTRANNNLTIDGVTKTVTEWAEYSQVTAGQIGRRVKAGWSHKDAVFGDRLRARAGEGRRR